MVLPQRLTIDLGLLATGHHVHVAKDLKATTMKVIGQKKLAKEKKLSDLLDMNSALKKIHAQLPTKSMVSGPGKKIGKDTTLFPPPPLPFTRATVVPL